MGYSAVQDVVGSGSATSQTATLSNVIPGNLGLFCLYANSGATATWSVPSGWTTLGNIEPGSIGAIGVFYRKMDGTESSVNSTLSSGPPTNAASHYYEFSGTNAGTPDSADTNSTAASLSISTHAGFLDLTTTSEFVFAWWGSTGGTHSAKTWTSTGHIADLTNIYNGNNQTFDGYGTNTSVSVSSIITLTWGTSSTAPLIIAGAWLAGSHNGKVSDTVTTSESVKVQITSFVNKSDSTATSENTNIAEVDTFSVSDTATTSENTKAEINDQINVNDTVTTGESDNFLSVDNIVVNDTTATSENVVVFQPFLSVNVNDTTTTSESILLLDTDGIGVLDSTTTSENVRVVITELFITTSDSTTTSENVKVEINSDINTSDTTTTSENTVVEGNNFINVNDSTTTSENVQVLKVLLINTSDSVTTSENTQLFLLEEINVNDTTVTSENQVISPVSSVNVSDTTTTSENTNVTKVLNITTSDIATTSENVSVRVPFLNIIVSDLIITSENVQITAPVVYNQIQEFTMIVNPTIGQTMIVPAAISTNIIIE